jgi:threonine/homoserine/homoserine lactone efflux protein
LQRLQFSASIDIILQRGFAMDVLTLATFALAFFVFAASPGPDNMTIVARTLTHGAGSGIAYGLGTVTGILLFLVLATFGLGLIASEMGFAMTILRYAGALWLIWMGIKLWTAKTEAAERGTLARSSILATYFTGVALNLGNPKMPLFYVALLPNIAGTALDFRMAAQLAVVILLVEAVVIGGHVALALRSRRILRSPKIMRRVNRTAGTVMIGSGAIALAAR